MIVPKIVFNKNQIENILQASRKLKTFVEKERYELPRQFAGHYYKVLITNLNSGKHMGSFQYGRTPGSRRYLKWKADYGSADKGPWRLADDLIKSIKVTSYNNGYLTGIRSELKDRGGKSWFGTKDKPKGKKKPIAMYARVLEFGMEDNPDQYHPPRPMFGPALEDFISSDLEWRIKRTMHRMGLTWK